jgi:TolB-like protein
VKSRLDLVVSDLGSTQLKNIAEPIRVYSLQVGVSAQAKSAPEPHRQPAPRLSMVVLPFANIGGDPEQEYFADGVTESLTTDLSRLSGSFVIGRNTAFTYKGKPVDLKQIGRDLNVRYVLEGSVQRSGNRLRVNVQLIDADSGAHLWAERFDKPMADLFDMQDEIVARLAGQLGAQLIGAEARRAARTPVPDSMDLYFQGMALLNKGMSSENVAQARGFFDRAVALDPGNLHALLGTASVDVMVAGDYMADKGPSAAAAEATLTKVLSLAPNNAEAHLWMGTVQVVTNRGVQGIAEYEQALSLDPCLAAAHARIGFAKIASGRAEDAEGHVLEALRLSPRDTFAYRWVGYIAAAKLLLGADEEAIVWYRRAIKINPNYPIGHLYLAAALEGLGRHDEARTEAQTARTLNPSLTIRRIRAGAQSDNAVFLKQRERVIEGMRKAGVPEE